MLCMKLVARLSHGQCTHCMLVPMLWQAAQANRERAYGHDERLGNHLFNHPIFQAVGMFLGRSCWLGAPLR